MPEKETENKNSRRYSLVPILSDSHINAGEKIEVSLFISGFSKNNADLDPVSNKLFVSFSNKILAENDGSYWQNSVRFSQSESQVKIGAGEEFIDRMNIEEDTSGIGHALHPGFFGVRDGPPTPNGLPPILAESAHAGVPPLKLVLKTSEDADSGDYPIHFIFTYGNIEVQQDRQTINIHINSWVEKYKRLLQILGAIGTIAALFSLFVSAANILHFI